MEEARVTSVNVTAKIYVITHCIAASPCKDCMIMSSLSAQVSEGLRLSLLLLSIENAVPVREKIALIEPNTEPLRPRLLESK